MRRVTIAVIGNGKTSRANVEALIGDVFDSVDESSLIVLSNASSDGSTWAQQYAESRGVPVQVVPSIPHNDENLRLFLLWDDEDSACQEAAAVAQNHNIPMFDLTDGLVRIVPKSDPIAPVIPAEIPEVETRVRPEEETKPAKLSAPVEEEYEEEMSEEPEEEVAYTELGDMLVEAFEEAARVMAAAFVEEVKRLLKGDDAD